MSEDFEELSRAELLQIVRRLANLDLGGASTNTASASSAEARTVPEDRRYYCVWRLPSPSATRGAGIYYGIHPAAWTAIQEQSGPRPLAVGTRLRRYDSLESARAGWLVDAAKTLRSALPRVPAEHQCQ